MYRWDRFLFAVLGSALVAGGVSSCAQTDPDAVATAKGWVLTEAQLSSEFDRVNDEISYAQATPEQKIDFANLLADKELLLGIARQACPEPDYKRERLDRIMWEKTLSRMFLEDRRRRFKLAPEEHARQLQLVSREAKVKLASIKNADFDSVLAACQRGTPFPQVVERYAMETGPGAPRLVDTGIRIGQGPRELVRAILLNDVPVGTVVGPVRTTRGVFLCEVQEFLPFDLNAQPEALERAQAVVEDLNYIPFNKVYTDSLFGLAGLKIHEEQIPLIAERFTAHWDSINAALPDVDFQTLRSPVWRFSAEEMALPIYDLFGRTYTMGEFVRSLDLIDLDYWPTPNREKAMNKTRFQVEQRAYRLLYEMEAEKTGYTENPDFLATVQRLYEQHLLEQFRERTLKPTVEPTDEQMQALYSEHQEMYFSDEQVAFGVLIFPPSEERRARSVQAELARSPEKWAEIGAAEAARGTGVQFLADTGLGRAVDAPPDPSWTPFRDTAVAMEANQISDVVQTQHGFSIVYCSQRLHSKQLSFEEAREKVRPAMIDILADQEIDRRIAEARAARKVEIFEEKLGGTAA